MEKTDLAGQPWLIIVIELSGVQFGLKSDVWFQNRRSTQCKFDLKSQVWFQTKIARHKVQLPLFYSHFEITEFSQFDEKQNKAFTSHFVFETEKMQHGAKMVGLKTNMI